jgi:hypothetical protein
MVLDRPTGQDKPASTPSGSVPPESWHAESGPPQKPHNEPDRDSVDPRTPVQRDADHLKSLEDSARSKENSLDRQAALSGIQKDAHDLSSQGLDYAKSVYAELAKRDGDSHTVPLVELTNNGLELQSSDKVKANIAHDQSNPTVQADRTLDRIIRSNYGLPNTATDAAVSKEANKRLDADMRKSYDLPVTATDKELKAAEDKQQHDEMRKLYGLPPTASDNELKATEDKQQHDEIRKLYGLPATASDKDLQAAEIASQDAEVAHLRSLEK